MSFRDQGKTFVKVVNLGNFSVSPYSNYITYYISITHNSMSILSVKRACDVSFEKPSN